MFCSFFKNRFFLSFQVRVISQKVGKEDGSNPASKATSTSIEHTSKPKGNVTQCKEIIFSFTTSKCIYMYVYIRHSQLNNFFPVPRKLVIHRNLHELSSVFFLPFFQHRIQYPTNRTLVSYHLRVSIYYI